MIRAEERWRDDRGRHVSAWVVACVVAGCGGGSGVAPAAAAPSRAIESGPASSSRGDGEPEQIAEGPAPDAGPGPGDGKQRPDEPKPAPVASGELVDAVKTSRPRAELSSFLQKPAEAAAAKRQWTTAIPMYQALVVARGPASAEARKLATLWTLAGQY
jgi:hypothetical protein